MPLLLFPTLFGTAIAGFFALSQRVTKTPLKIIARAIGEVFKQRASQDFIDSGSCRRLFLATLNRLFLLSVVPFGILFFCAPSIFSIVFGQQWKAAGIYTQIMIFSYWLQFIVHPLSNVFFISGKQKLALFIKIYTSFFYLLSFRRHKIIPVQTSLLY